MSVEESSFNINMARNREYTRVSRSPVYYISTKGLNISIIVATNPGLDVHYKIHLGVVTTYIFRIFLEDLIPKLKKGL